MRGKRMLKLKSCSGELLMSTIAPTDTDFSFSHTHTHKHSCNLQLLVCTGNGILVALSGFGERVGGGMCKCFVVSGPSERDVCSCCLNSECSVCVCVCCVRVRQAKG